MGVGTARWREIDAALPSFSTFAPPPLPLRRLPQPQAPRGGLVLWSAAASNRDFIYRCHCLRVQALGTKNEVMQCTYTYMHTLGYVCVGYVLFSLIEHRTCRTKYSKSKFIRTFLAIRRFLACSTRFHFLNIPRNVPCHPRQGSVDGYSVIWI